MCRGPDPFPPLRIHQPQTVEMTQIGREGTERPNGKEVFVQREELEDSRVGTAGQDDEGGGGGGGLEAAGGGVGGGVVGLGPEFGEAYGGGEGVEVGCAVGEDYVEE